MLELKVTDETERQLLLAALISHISKCRDVIRLHGETKEALKDAAIGSIAQRASDEMHQALTLIAKYFGVHLSNSKFYCLDCAPIEGEEFDRLTQPDFAWANDCSKCGMGAFYFVEPNLEITS